jgi:NAD(P)-dependent dehydrogenase (short-subunit alcohol dehydrogenase family)
MVARQTLPVALVTGGARRIGRSIVEDLARNGWAVAIHYRASREEAEQTAGAIRAAGGVAAIVQGDLGNAADVRRIVPDAAEALGPLTLLVNNASIFEADRLGSLNHAQWQRQFAVNLCAPVMLAEAFAAQLPGDAEGNIVNLLDQRVFRPTPDHFSYQLTKSALLTATEIMAKALAPRIRVNGIAPGPVLQSAQSTPEKFAAFVAALPLERQPDLADFGRTVRYFLENRSITGQVIALDGGQRLA